MIPGLSNYTGSRVPIKYTRTLRGLVGHETLWDTVTFTTGPDPKDGPPPRPLVTGREDGRGPEDPPPQTPRLVTLRDAILTHPPSHPRRDEENRDPATGPQTKVPVVSQRYRNLDRRRGRGSRGKSSILELFVSLERPGGTRVDVLPPLSQPEGPDTLLRPGTGGTSLRGPDTLVGRLLPLVVVVVVVHRVRLVYLGVPRGGRSGGRFLRDPTPTGP